ncbi:hypothetical protein MA16_Dca022255 [Dendrobium catenatum]|uniref:Uncharacterized protein n=1 Tax=Dendrobium catenatum TaxID=906689 RepID=A0A2I0W2W6_9ASPA|nr:hypothetical protein MA16_Dca022255 [Dendrobium catenatum]
MLSLNNCNVNCIDVGGLVGVNLDSGAMEQAASIPLGNPSEAVNVGIAIDVFSLGVGSHDSTGAVVEGLQLGRVLVLLLMLVMQCLMVHWFFLHIL